MGELKREYLRWFLFNAYREGNLTTEDVVAIVIRAYSEGDLERGEIAWLLADAFRVGELNETWLYILFAASLKSEDLTVEDIAFILQLGHRLNIMKEEHIAHILILLMKVGDINAEEMLFILILMRRDGELAEMRLVSILMKTYTSGAIDRPRTAAILIWAYKNGYFDQEDIKYILVWFMRHNDMSSITKEDIEAILAELHEAGILKNVSPQDIFDAEPPEKNTIDFADNWQRIGRLTWISDAELWDNENSNRSRKVQVYYQIHGAEKVVKPVEWIHERNLTEGIFSGFLIRGGYVYPAGYRVFHDPNFIGEANLFTPPGGVQVAPDEINEKGDVKYDDFDEDEEANIPLNEGKVVEAEFRNRKGRKVVCKFKGEGTVNWQWVDESGVPDQAKADVPEGRVIIGNFIIAEIDGDLDWFHVEIHYEEEDLPEGVDEGTLTIHYWDMNSNGWQECEKVSVDTDKNIVSANVTHFTIFAPMAEQKQMGANRQESDNDTVLIIVVVLVAVFTVVSLVAVFMRKRRKRNPEDEDWEEDLPNNEDEVDWERYRD